MECLRESTAGKRRERSTDGVHTMQAANHAAALAAVHEIDADDFTRRGPQGVGRAHEWSEAVEIFERLQRPWYFSD